MTPHAVQHIVQAAESGMSPWLAGMFVEYGRAYGAGWGDFTTSHVKDVAGCDAHTLLDFARDFWPRAS